MYPVKAVLLVDDDPTTNYINQYMIKRTGLCEVIHEVSDGKKAMEFLMTQRDNQDKAYPPAIDLIVLDLNMMVVDGFDFLDWYMAQDWLDQKAKIIIVTTSDHAEDMAKAKEYPCVLDYFVKPISLDTWLDLLYKLDEKKEVFS